LRSIAPTNERRRSFGEGGSLNELGPGLEDPAAAGLRTRKFLGTEKDNLPTKHTKHPKEKKPVLPVLVCFRVFGGQRSPLLQRLHDPESRIDQDQEHEHEQDAMIVDPKVAACFTDTRIAQMLGYLNITGLDLALRLNFKNVRLESRPALARSWRPRHI
jgi:PD-(D/E)XK nuclease superfamily protein